MRLASASAELFDIDADQFVGLLAFVAADRFGEFQGLQIVEPRRRKMRLTLVGESANSANSVEGGRKQ